MSGVATFPEQNGVEGFVEFIDTYKGCRVKAIFSKLPAGKHGFHIHKAGDLRGEGCQGACDHYHKGPETQHGGPPTRQGPRHTGDLGNIGPAPYTKIYYLENVSVSELYGRSVIVHADEDDLGKGHEEDSLTTGHSGKRIGCAIIGRATQDSCGKKTRKAKQV